MQEGVDEPGIVCQVWGESEVARDGVVRTELVDGVADHVQRFVVLTEPHVLEDRLHNLHADTSVVGVEHDREDAIRS